MRTPDRIDDLAAALARPGRPSSDYDLNPDVALAGDRVLRPAAVLIPVLSTPQGARLILTKRASHLAHHPGQIAFPGGKLDAGDADAAACARREASEEIGLDAANNEILGILDPHETVTGFSVTPVLCRVLADFEPRPQADEVAEVFTVPLAHVLDSGQYRIERRLWRGQWRRYYAVPYGPYYIWGATARILRALVDRMG
jgi:8-oxo-dGTP pyrophosphatase MutT (NUDIX family)